MITRAFWPVMANSAPDGYKLFGFFVPFDVLGKFYDELPALMDMGVSIGLLDRSVKESALIIMHQPHCQNNGPPRRKLHSRHTHAFVDLVTHPSMFVEGEYKCGYPPSAQI